MFDFQLEQYNELLGTLYEAAVDSSKWQVFLDGLGGLFGGTRFVLHGHNFRDNTGIGIVSSGFDPYFLGTYAEHYAAINPWAGVTQQMPMGEAQVPDTFYGHDELVRSEFYNGWLRPQGIDTAAGLVLHRDRYRVLNLSGNIRGVDAEEHQPRLTQLLDLLSPHLYRATSTYERIALLSSRHAFRDAHDRAEDAALLIDSQQRVVQANPSAAALLAGGQIVSTGSGGVLRFASNAATAAVGRGLEAIADGRLDLLPGSFDAGGGWTGALQPARSPLQPAQLFDFIVATAPVALVILRRPARWRLVGEAWRLTGSELVLLRALFEGTALPDFALQRGISHGTARNQLKSIFEKSHTHGQVELLGAVRRLTGEG